MIQVDTALVGFLSADAQLQALGVTGVWRGKAPEGSPLPYIIFLKQHGNRSYTLSRESDRLLLYTIKAVCGGNEAAGEDHTPAAQIDERIESILVDHLALPVAGYKVIELRRDADIDYPERNEGLSYQHVGGIYRIRLSV